MKIPSQFKNSSNISLILSLLFHFALIFIFSYQNREESRVKISRGPTIDLGGFQFHSGSSKTPSSLSGPNKTSVEGKPSSAIDVRSADADGPDAHVGVANGETEARTLTAKQDYYLEFRNIIESKKQYPALARARGIEGIVIVSVMIKRNGEVTNQKIVKSSGYDVLDQATFNLIKKIDKFKSFPAALDDAEVDFTIPMSYKLNN